MRALFKNESRLHKTKKDGEHFEVSVNIYELDNHVYIHDLNVCFSHLSHIPGETPVSLGFVCYSLLCISQEKHP